MSGAFDRVEVQRLEKRYGATRALGGVDLVFAAATTTVIEGSNGSGKSTLLSILAQLTRPTEGRVLYGDYAPLGRSIRTAEAIELRRRIGVLAHEPMLYSDLTGRENLTLFASLYGLEDPIRRISELERRFEIGDYVDRPARTWSRGQLQRIALARALLHEPKLLLLDEPATGLDVLGLEHLVQAIQSERDRGAIVLVVTHDAVFANQIASHRVRLERGRVAA